MLRGRCSDKGVLMRWLLLSLALVVGIAQSQEPPKSKTQEKKAKAEQRGTEQAPLFVKTPGPATQAERDSEAYEKHEKTANERIVTYATLALAVITGVLAFFTALLWLATYRLVRGAKDTARRQLRAYISLTEGEIVISEEKKEFRVVLKFINCGQTPAYSVSSSFEAEIRELQEVKRPEIGQVFPSAKPVGERGSNTIAGPGLHINTAEVKPFINDQLGSVGRGTSAIFVWGEINYIDIFDQPHWLKFRYVNGGKAHDKLKTNSGWHLQPCKEGNDADRDGNLA